MGDNIASAATNRNFLLTGWSRCIRTDLPTGKTEKW